MDYHGLPIRREVPLAAKTTIGLGGAARFFMEAHDGEILARAVTWARANQMSFLLLGGGSNLLLADDGFPGLVIAMEQRGRRLEQGQNDAVVDIMAGENWDALVAFTVENGLAGIECLSGIPGKAGAAPIQNIGAYGQELAETLLDVTVLDLATGESLTLSKADCCFAYRDSLFKQASGRFAVLSLRLKLRKGGAGAVRYLDLKKRLGPEASLAEVRETVLAVRRAKSMIFDPHDPNARSCGSFFTNPILDTRSFGNVSAALLSAGFEDFPHYDAGPGFSKLSAAWLIEHAGFPKGYRHGRVGLSEKHCLAVVNRDQGSALEVLELVAKIQDHVYQKFGVRLAPEPVILQPTAP